MADEWATCMCGILLPCVYHEEGEKEMTNDTRTPLSRCCAAPKGDDDRCPACFELSTFEVEERRTSQEPYDGPGKRFTDALNEYHGAYAQKPDDYREIAEHALAGMFLLIAVLGVYGFLYLLG